MHQSKLIKIFSVLSSEDLRQLQKMLKSPYFTSNENLQKFFKILRDKHPELNSPQLKKEIVFAKIFPKTKYSDIKIRNLMSEFRQIIEQLFILQQLKNDRTTQNRFLTSALTQKGNLELMDKQEKQLKKYIDEKVFHTIDFYYSKYDALQLRKKIIQSRNYTLTAELIQEADQTLDSFYLFAKTKLKLEFKNLSKFASIQKKTDTDNPLQENIAFQIYSDFNLLIDNNKIELFFNIRDRYFQNLKRIDKDTQVEILSLLINYTIQNMLVDDKKFNTIAFDTYQLAIEHQILAQSPLILEGHFYNIVVTASKEKQFKWAMDFIHSHKEFINPIHKDDITIASLAYLYFHQHEYNSVLETVAQHHFSNHNLNSTTKLLLIRCYYELFLQDDSYHEVLVAQTYSSEKHVQRNSKFSESKKKAFLNFIQFVRKLANTRLKGKLTKTEQNNMQNLLEEQEVTMSRSWLLKKIKQ